MSLRLKGVSFMKQFKYIKLIHILGFVGSTVIGEAICGGSTSPNLPTSEMAPDCRRDKISLFKNCVCCLQLDAF